jgi:hypothetical protein|tara:strand:- start:1293 stop:2192 length:900 start_codon:yes stop_codon:yes gene_type:complete
MSVFKSLTTSDVIVTPFKVNKTFTFQGASAITALNVGIDRFKGKNTPYISGSDNTGQINTQSQSLIYNSIKQLYYSNYLSGSNGSPANLPFRNLDNTISIQGNSSSYQPMYENYLPNTLLANRYFPTSSNDTIAVMSIPSNLFGEYIKPGTFNVSVNGNVYTDNGEGGLLNSSTQKIGDIIYAQGIATITSASTSDINNFTISSNITCSFQSTMTIFESQYKCTSLANEFNYTQNPSAISGSTNSGVVYDFLTGSYFQPYVTTIGLYNKANQLVAVGKLSQPLQNSNITDTTVLVNLDL